MCNMLVTTILPYDRMNKISLSMSFYCKSIFLGLSCLMLTTPPYTVSQ